MDIKRAYKFRFYPTPNQITILGNTFGSARFVYNHMLKLRTDSWYNNHTRIGFHQTCLMLPLLKKTQGTEWLSEVSSVTLQQSLHHLQTAFNNFFAKRTGYPKFKSKHSDQSVTYTSSGFKWDGQRILLAKMSEPLDIRFSRSVPKGAKVTMCTVLKDKADRYFISMQCDDVAVALPKNSKSVGVDLGLSHFAVLSDGEKIAAQNMLCKNEKKMVKLQRRLSKKQKGSKNRAKARLKVARLHASIADSRKDFLHKLSTRLIRENQTIAIETLAIKKMQQNKIIARSISDAGWGEFARQLEYKAKWYGRTLIGIDRWYPSSKRCSDCGHMVSKMPMTTRSWICPVCGVSHDRDINAARNILAAGLAVSALGESVSPTQAYA